MRTFKPYYFFLLLLLVMSSACQRKRMVESVTLRPTDKNPYGTWYAYQELKWLFPRAEMVKKKEEATTKNASKALQEENDYWTKLYENRGHVAQVIVTPYVDADDEQIQAAVDFINSGNHLFLSAFDIDNTLLDSLQVNVKLSPVNFDEEDSLRVNIDHPVTGEQGSFHYPGKAFDRYFAAIDTTHVTVLGTNVEGKPNFIKMEYVNGASIYVHLAPLAFSNFFLLHRQNKQYFDQALSYLPADVKVITWSRIERKRDDPGSFSALGWLMKQSSLRNALWLLLLLVAIVYLFESKRRQRIIPDIAPLRNASLDFVKTIGRLYFQRKDNNNLANKMMAHFLDHVRTRYNIRATAMDSEFEKRLSYKSGYPAEKLQSLVYLMHQVHLTPEVPDQLLLELNQQLEQFYAYGK